MFNFLLKLNQMKRLFFLLITSMAMLSSCARYYVNTLSSSNTKKEESTGRFIFENDSLTVVYNFYGKDAQISLDVYNKLNEPLYLNWQQSALINGDKATSYMGETANISGQISSSTIKWSKDYSSSNSSLNASIDIPKEISFIPPKSRITKSTLKLAIINYKDIPDSLFSKTLLDVSQVATGIWAKKAQFDAGNSPMSFKSFLTFYTVKDNTPKSFWLQQDFYLSDLIKTGVNPTTITSLGNNPGNVFYLKEKTGYGKASEGFGYGLAILAVSAADAAINQPKSK